MESETLRKTMLLGLDDTGLNQKVFDLWEQGRGWAWNKLDHWLNSSSLLQLATTMMDPSRQKVTGFAGRLREEVPLTSN